MNELIQKQEILYNKIMKRLNTDSVKSNDEIASYLDVANAVTKGIGKYNETLLKKEKINLKKINKKTRKTRGFPKAIKLVSCVNNDTVEIQIYFEGYERIILSANSYGDYFIKHSDFDIEKTSEFINKNIDIYHDMFVNLFEFKYNYPDIEYTFENKNYYNNNENKYSQLISDGFIIYNINMDSTEKSLPCFKDYNDINIACTHSRKFGRLEDYIEQCSSEFLSKSYIERSQLNPLINKMLDNYLYQLNKEKQYSLVK